MSKMLTEELIHLIGDAKAYLMNQKPWQPPKKHLEEKPLLKLSTSKSEGLTQQFSDDANGQKPLASQKSTKASKVPECEGEKPNTHLLKPEKPYPVSKQVEQHQALVIKKEKNPPLAPLDVQGWELLPLAPYEPRLFLQESFASYFKIVPFEVPIRLVLPIEERSHRLFLEGLARALTRHMGPALVVSASTTPLVDATTRLLLIPLSSLHKKYPHAKIHQPLQADNLTFIPLAPCELYLRDTQTKRALWSAIQHSFRL